MKINIIFPCLATKASGGHKVLYEYANKLVKKGYDITCYYLPSNTFYQLKLPEFLRIKILKYFIKFIGPSKWFKLDRRIKNELCVNIREADIIIATAVETVEIVANQKPEKGKKIYFIQDFENWNYSEEYLYSTYNLGFINIVVSNWLKNIVDKYSSSFSYLISNGINTKVFYNQNNERINHSIVFQYRSAGYKGCKYSIDVIEKLHEIYKDLHVDVISIEPKPSSLPNYCTYHHKLTADEIARINNQNQVFLCTSIEEGFGLPGLEAMACGCVVVSTCYEGVLEYAVDGKNALLSSVKDVDSIVKNIIKVFNDNELRDSLIKEGNKTVKERSIDNSVSLLENIFLSFK